MYKNFSASILLLMTRLFEEVLMLKPYASNPVKSVIHPKYFNLSRNNSLFVMATNASK